MWKEGKVDYRLYCKEEENYRQRKLAEGESDPREEEY